MNDVQYWTVYIIRNEALPMNKREGRGSRYIYVGMTNNLDKRLREHNDGESKSTKGGMWELETALHYRAKSQAVCVERWLKNGDSRGKRNEVIERMKRNGNSETEAMRIYWFAERWFNSKFGITTQGDNGL